MKILLAILILVTIWTHGHASDKPYVAPTPTTTTTTSTPLTLPTSQTYGLLALATAGNQLDWGVPNKLQVSVAGAFTEGGNQAIAFGVGTRFGGVLVNAHFATTIDAPDAEDDYAIVVGGTMHF